MMTPAPRMRAGIARSSTVLSSPPVREERTSPATAIKGAVTPSRSSKERNIWTLVTSEVLRVTRLAVPNRSISAAEKLCTWWKISCRKSAAKRVDTFAERTVAATLNTQPRMDRAAITAATTTMALRLWPATPTSIMLARAVGSSILVTAERSIRASRAATLLPLSRTREKMVRIHSPFSLFSGVIPLTGGYLNDSIKETLVSTRP